MYARKTATEGRLERGVGQTTPIFSYGSNSTSQLRARVCNPKLQAFAARLHGYCRVFAGDGLTWGGGGVASLQRSQGDKKHRCLGSVVYLTNDELEKLTLYEGGYDLVSIEVEVFHGCRSGPIDDDDDDNVGETITASTFIKRNCAFVEPPSEAYLTAIIVHLREHFHAKNLTIDISEVSRVDTLVTRGRYIAPPPSLLLTLEALMVEVNSHSLQESKWEMPRKGSQVAASLRVSASSD